MAFQKINPPTLKELFIDQVLDMILNGEVNIGDKLPPERRLAELTRVSRAVVHSGIIELEKCGFLRIKPRSGVYVADYRRDGNLETLVFMTNYRGGKIGNREIRSILEVRCALEMLVLRQAVPKADERTVAALKGHLDRMRDAADSDGVIRAAYDFQHELALAADNTIVPLIFQSFRDTIYAMWERFCSIYGTDALYANDLRLWAHIRDRDLESAMAWVRHTTDACLDGDMQFYYSR